MSDNPLIPQSSERLSPNEIASKTFTVTRRGFKAEEVNRYLALIGTYISEQHRMYDLLAAKAKSQSSATANSEAQLTRKLDLASITSALGEEAAEILKSASAAGESIRAKANEYARAVREAADNAVAEQEAAHRLEMADELSVHRAEIDRITQEANTKITSEVQRAEELARTLVQEARSDADSIIRKAKEVRAEVYAEIDRRTNEARDVLQLIEAHKEQLTSELRGVNVALDSLLDEVDPVKLAEASPTLNEEGSGGGEVPPVGSQAEEVLIAPIGDDDVTSISPADTSPVEKEIETKSPPKVLFFDDTESIEIAAEEGEAIYGGANNERSAKGNLGEWPSIRSNPRQPPQEVQEVEREVEDDFFDDESQSVAGEAGEIIEVESSYTEVTVSTKSSTYGLSEKRHGDHLVVENIFSRLLERSDNEHELQSNLAELSPANGEDEVLNHSGVTDESFEADPAGSIDDDELEPAPESLSNAISAMYDESFSPLRSQATRRIKRVVQDDQNALLEGLRIGGVEEARRIVTDTQAIARAYSEVMASFVQPIVEQSSRYFSQIQRIQGVPDGRWNVSVKPSVEMKAAVDELAVELAEEVSSRVLSVIGAGIGDDLAALSTRLGATFRELKTEFVETLVSDMISILVSTWLITCTDVAKVTWVRGGPGGCADCEDNELEGIIDVGSNFPTGNPAPPAHIGCRCLLVPYFA